MSDSTPQSGSRPKVVVVGAGFAGINAVHQLARHEVDVTLVDRNNFHTFQPLLYQVATSYLPPEQVGATIRAVFRKQRNVKVRVGRVDDVDWDERAVVLEDGDRLPYDYLVVAAGATTNFFGISGMEDHAWPLYTMGDAVRLRLHLLEELERAAAEPSADLARQTVVVVGGGPTGVETAGALAAMGKEHVGGDVDMRVVLVEALPRLLNTFSEKSGRQALDDLRRRGVEVLLDTAVASADDKGVTFKSGERIDTRTVVWAAGVQASPLGRAVGVELGKGGSIVVGPDLQVKGHPGVFAAGDIASISPPPHGTPPPLVAPNAIQQGKHVGRQIARLGAGEQTEPFSYFDKGSMAVIARGDAVTEIPVPGLRGRILRVAGLPAWLLWAGVHVVYLIGFRNRVKTLTDWLWSSLTSSGGGAILVRATRTPKPDVG
ncbi:NADH dehydrogenase [Motilibacter peucedani]|uniref:NADH:ubiquinone reductase (non-electrogenic) n=1 Tax=Motilibacter peucedani TaxID=598650 RepID=A0A420XPH2_9ACTN|nr:NAD(P)/FAD-dependent oxidoreductase [Motilibacter peucedani]RKS74072.1 NADH dehydrogenase [Motilibacter peucedani]